MLKKALQRLYNYLDQTLYDDTRNALEEKIEALEECTVTLEGLLERARDEISDLEYRNDFYSRRRA